MPVRRVRYRLQSVCAQQAKMLPPAVGVGMPPPGHSAKRNEPLSEGDLHLFFARLRNPPPEVKAPHRTHATSREGGLVRITNQVCPLSAATE